MKKIDLKVLYQYKQNELLNSLKSSNSFPHPTSNGNIKEESWISFFREILPKRYAIDSGFVIDCNNHISEQIDLIIYDNYYSPIIFQLEGEKYIPIESVFAIFEIKPQLRKSTLTYAIKKISSVKKLERTSNSINTINGRTKFDEKNKEIISGLLTTNSSWTDSETNIRKNLACLVKSDNDEISLISSVENFTYSINYENGITIETDDSVFPILYLYFKLLKMLQSFGNPLPIDFDRFNINGL